jgi:hypothetical protein
MDEFTFDLSSNPFQPQDRFHFLTDDLPPSDGPRSSAPGFKRVKWSMHEDELLTQAVAAYGLGNWSTVASTIPHRNAKQCRERWLNQLCPGLNKDEWTPHEDAVLLQQQRVFGNSWAQITRFLPGRAPNAAKNRWFWLSRNIPSAYSHAKMDLDGGRRTSGITPRRAHAPPAAPGTGCSDPGAVSQTAGAVPSEMAEAGRIFSPNHSRRPDEDDDGGEFMQRAGPWQLRF